MRIAVLVYGRLNKCCEHHQNIVKSLGEDNHIDFFLSSDNAPVSQLNNFIHLYSPVLYSNYPTRYACNLSKYPGKRSETNIHKMTCHFINKNRVFKLLEIYADKNSIQYDCVVSLRVDCVFQDKFDLSSLDNNTIYIPFNYDYVDNGINDQVAYGQMDVMKKYNYINPLYLLNKRLSIPHPESLNYANIKLHKLNIKRPSINYYLDK